MVGGFEGFRMLPYILLALAVAGIIGGAATVSLAEFGDTVSTCFNDSWTYNAADDVCRNNTLVTFTEASLANRNFSATYDVVWQGMDSEVTVASQMSTVAVIGVMVIIIGMLAGVFAYFRYFR